MRYLTVCCLALWLSPSMLMAAESHVGVRQNGTMLTVEGWLTTSAELPRAWHVLTDYARFAEFVPGIHDSRVVEARDHVKLVAQRGEVVAGQFRMPYQGVMRIEETAHQSIRIHFLSGPFEDARGEWTLQPGKPLRLRYRLQMDLMKSPFPPPLAPGIAEQQVRTWLEVFGREMELTRRNAQ